VAPFSTKRCEKGVDFPAASLTFSREITTMDDYTHEKDRIDLTGHESTEYGNFWNTSVYSRFDHTPSNDYEVDHIPPYQLFGNSCCIQYQFAVPGEDGGMQLLL
jgi:hypothetical protein